MDSSKTYCCLPNDLLIRKFEAYVNDKNGLNLIPIKSYRKNKNSSSFSDCYDIIRDIPLGSISGPLFFSLLLISIFLSKEQIHAISPMIIYNFNINLEAILKDPQYNMQKILKWFKVNSMKTYPKKFQFMILCQASCVENYKELFN